MFNWMRNSCNKTVSSLSKHEKKSDISEFSSLMESNQTIVTDEDQATSGENEIVAACKRKFQTLRSKNKLSSPPISSCASFDSLEFLEDDTKIKEFDFNESKENESFLNRLFNISSKNNKIIEYIYKKAKALSRPSSRRTSQNETSEQSEETENKPLIDHAADNHNDDTFLDDEFINHIEHDTSQNLGNTTTESTVGKLLFGVNLNYQTTFNDMYELFQKKKCS
ncbi:hypothetical protein HZH68_006455 [Vespula germanica]|uniref:Uncharacterized protein n=1 Tax=Vespula germanica TaxID=30212 RepID=A0A834KDC6_VESGE|nr:hypothetical protein HZH68_006455 [Vespula germanica]